MVPAASISVWNLSSWNFSLLSGFTLRTAHFVYAVTECGLTTDFPYKFMPGFLGSGTIDLLDWMILCFKSCPMHCRMVSWPPPTRALPSVTIKTVFRHCQVFPGGENCL